MLHMSRKMQTTTHAQDAVSLRNGGRAIADLLHEMYVTRSQSQADIADELGVTRNTIAMWLREYGITRDDRPAVAL